MSGRAGVYSYKLQKFEFDQLEHRLVEEFPNLKRSSLVLSLQATGKDMIQLKVAELRSRVSTIAALSGLVVVPPIPLLSTAVDLGLDKRSRLLLHATGPR